jgi:hypothetical protein
LDINWKHVSFPPTKIVLKRVEEEVFFKEVKQQSDEAKNASMTFQDILPKEQFYGLLWGYEFSIKRVQTC